MHPFFAHAMPLSLYIIILSLYIYNLKECYFYTVMPFRDICDSVFCYGQYHYRRSGQWVKEEEETQSPHDKQVNVVNDIFLDYYIFAHFYRPRGCTPEREKERERWERETDACLYCRWCCPRRRPRGTMHFIHNSSFLLIVLHYPF